MAATCVDTAVFNNTTDLVFNTACTKYKALYTEKLIDSEVLAKGLVDLVRTSVATGLDYATKATLVNIQEQSAQAELDGKKYQVNNMMPRQLAELEQRIFDSAVNTERATKLADADYKIKSYQLECILPSQAIDAIATAKVKTIQSDMLAPIQVEEANAKMTEIIKASKRADDMNTVDVAMKNYQLSNIMPLQRNESEAKVVTALTQADSTIKMTACDLVLKGKQVEEITARICMATAQAGLYTSQATVACEEIGIGVCRKALIGAQITKTNCDSAATAAQTSLTNTQATQLCNSIVDNKKIRGIQAQSDLLSALAMGKRSIPTGLLVDFLCQTYCLNTYSSNQTLSSYNIT